VNVRCQSTILVKLAGMAADASDVDVTQPRASAADLAGFELSASSPVELLDAPPNESFDRLTRMVVRLLDVPLSFLTLIDADRDLLLSQAGRGAPRVSPGEIPLATALAAHIASGRGGPLVVPDMRADEWLLGDASLAEAGVIAYAGMPLLVGGDCVGALWAADEQPRAWTVEDLAALEDVTALAAVELELRATQLDRDQAQLTLEESETRIRRAFDAASVGMVMTSLAPASAGRILHVNQAFCDFLGRTETSLLGVNIAEITDPQDVAVSEEAIDSLIKGEPLRHLEKRYLHAGGQVVWAAITTSGMIPGDNSPYVVSVVEDVTERKQAERDLPAIANVLRRILSGEDARQAIVKAAVDIAGASSAHLAERADPGTLTVTASVGLNLIGVDVKLAVPSATASVFESGKALFVADPRGHPLVSSELLDLSQAASIMWQPIFDHEGVIGVLCVCWSERIDDISARAAHAVALLTVETAVALAHHDALERLAAQAITDPLTELPNRRAWDERLRRDLASARRTGRPLTLALLDMDRFKRYNDSEGHAAGDELLREFASRGCQLLREGDTLARWGGEEFAILLPECPSGDFARTILERIRGAVPAGQSCSVGYASWDGQESAAQLVRRADRALYRAKALGRDRSASAEDERDLPSA
jgi:diguanylate cyclase (GGDEF)-like protein/PAS domain S-box-containing protein